MVSIDAVRRQMALNGKSIIDKAINTANEAREKKNKLKKIKTYGK